MKAISVTMIFQKMGAPLLLLATKSEDQDKTKTPSPIVIDRYQFKRDYEGFLENKRDHLYVFNTKSRKTRQITSGQRDHSYPSISPDGKSLAYVTKRRGF